ncbi:MAG: nickel pincer cofactor biosynthesis protein LarB [Chloroflexi bacterium]|nr:nickel pincer cofactor biosynthesis protein LarB [Chloroflexota bacterium]
MEHSPLADVVAAVAGLEQASPGFCGNPDIHPDLRREARTGVPEVILARGKEPEQIRTLVRTFVERTGRAIVSRIADDLARDIAGEYPDHWVHHERRARMLVIRQPDLRIPTGGAVGIIAAGTADLPVAAEARIMAEEMGCTVTMVADVGVAGLHRLFAPLKAMLDAGVDVIIVVAGMDGALPSVVAGLVDVPVIGLPTSTGYGIGGGGLAALLSMLQTCAPGLSVVNIDNGVGAGISAALIARRVAQARGR